ncbi:hypothetical protein [Winogradskyella sp. SYSU M77433]|uniref:hypothetical protein n=1 Tax=Winogradskyella sp. SYSU M77433 TaxID=3042722 RepID=UPI0024801EAA|nr:hypothetical protein [Winogradskyella sp. SYSU M77433]MDH7913025.1 hypothetical protein [Winogradskyella sp. SYSU M77433]
MNKIRILVLCLITTFGYAQKKLNKTSQSVKVNKDVVVDLNTSYVEIEIDTWNKDVVEVEAYLESSKLSEEELKKALAAWNLTIDGSSDKVVISSSGGRSFGLHNEGDYSVLLKDLEFELANIPDIPEIPELPDLPEMAEFPAMPKMPKLPELPSGIKAVHFDYERYQEEGEKYLAEWSKKYEEKGGKELQKRMEAWAKKFSESGYQEKMEKWGEEFAKSFEGEWAKDMEKWGEKFGEKYGKDMEKWGEEFGEKFGEEWAEKMEAWGERFGKQMEEHAKAMEKRTEAMAKRQEEQAKRHEERAKRQEEMAHRRATTLRSRADFGSNSNVKKVIKIKIPKKAKLKTNIRHGELKLSSVIYNMKGELSHSYLVAEHIDGGDTSINVSYSPVVINNWNLGTLNLNFVDKAQITKATHLVLNSKSSNVNIVQLSDTGIIDGSFGDLTISDLTSTFKNLNLVLENSDALVNLPKNINYSLYFKGNRSKYNNQSTTQKTVRNYPDGQSSGGNIIVNAKFSNVIMN